MFQNQQQFKKSFLISAQNIKVANAKKVNSTNQSLTRSKAIDTGKRSATGGTGNSSQNQFNVQQYQTIQNQPGHNLYAPQPNSSIMNTIAVNPRAERAVHPSGAKRVDTANRIRSV